MLNTFLPDAARQPSEEAVSVIHAPESFASWVSDLHRQRKQEEAVTNFQDRSLLKHPLNRASLTAKAPPRPMRKHWQS